MIIEGVQIAHLLWAQHRSVFINNGAGSFHQSTVDEQPRTFPRRSLQTHRSHRISQITACTYPFSQGPTNYSFGETLKELSEIGIKRFVPCFHRSCDRQ